MRKLTAFFTATILALHLTACTSGDSREDGTEDGAVAESTEGTDADLANLDAPPAENTDGAAVASNDGANEGFLDEQLPEDALGESNKPIAAEPPPAVDIADNATPPPAMEEPPAMTEAAPIETPSDSSVAAIDTGSTPSDTTSSLDTSSSMASTTSTEPSLTEEKPKAAPVSLKKVETAPFTREGVLLNAVYVARSGDNYKKISQLIYGNDSKVKELKKVNPSVKPRVGDKIYYNSPVRAADDTKILTYYEDAGLVPDVYVTKEGDNLKKVGKELLGNKDSWKELWATNMMVESKDALPAGTELRYWKSAPVAMTEAPKQEVAMNAPPAELPPPMMETPPPMPETPPPAEMAPPPPPPVAEMAPPPPPPAEMAPPPPPPEMAPPPPPAEAINPPPPPTVAKKAPQDMETGGMDNDMMMSLAGAGIIAAGLAAVIIIRKRRQNRDMAQAFNDTQVGT